MSNHKPKIVDTLPTHLKYDFDKCSFIKSSFLKYQKAINQIDDYFEYRNESAKDKRHVMSIIDGLTKSMKK